MRPCWLPVQSSTSSAPAVTPARAIHEAPAARSSGAAARGRVVEQPAEIPVRREVRERRQQGCPLRLRDRVRRVVLAEVDEPLRGSGGVGRSSDERAASHLAGHQPAPRRFRVGPADRPDGDAQTLRQLPVRRQPVPFLEGAPCKVIGKCLDDREIARTLPPSEIGAPDCHGDNIAIDTHPFHH